MFISAIAVAGLVFWLLVEVLSVRQFKTETELTSKTLFDMVKLAFGVVAGSGALVALVVAYRRQRVDEDGALREATRLHTERFGNAVAQLGDASPAVQLGGVHALAGLADDAPTRDLRQTCIDVLCAYLRLPYAPDPGDEDQEGHHAYRALREVRHTVIRLIREHLNFPLDHPRSWCGHNFDFTGAIFDGGSFTGARFTGGFVSFFEARFIDGMVLFDRVEFHDHCSVVFDEAEFAGGQVIFVSAKFAGGIVDFQDARFSGGVVNFNSAQFSGADVEFSSARFGECEVTFFGADFIGGSVSFNFTQLSGGNVNFIAARFNGGTVDMEQVDGDPPMGVVPEAGTPLPEGLVVPDRWLEPS